MDRAPRREDRSYRRDDDRRDQRSSRNDRDRSRSPVRRDQHRDERRRERSPPSRSHQNFPPRGAPPRRSDDSRDPEPRRRAGSRSPPPPSTRDRRAGDSAPRTSRPGADAQASGNFERDQRQQQAGGHGLAARHEVPADEDDEAAMQRLMGFATFRTTKNTKVPGNERNYAVAKVKKTEYRQYMNRLGGFNRALSPSR